NSLLEAVVFARRAFAEIAPNFKNELFKNVAEKIAPWDESGTKNPDEWILLQHDKKEIQQLMWDYVGIVRSELRLKRALKRIDLIRDEIEEFYKRTTVSEDLLELRNLATVAWLIITSAQARKESRGLHYMTDYPERDDANWLHDTIVNQ
ncbi:MAG TPA: L-aspartate oxidase, partial [Patescibacteria group bacterium]|nr:L-aspartate oxidase [Patescibacteria group bacterium]